MFLNKDIDSQDTDKLKFIDLSVLTQYHLL